jgi:protein arginine N-methyltransferase 1
VELLETTQLLAYHRAMLADTERVDGYHDAIHAVVKEGDVVVDVGAGTGLLSYFACQAGARRVFAIEAGPIVSVARQLCQANGFADRVEFLAGHSSQVTLPEAADVLVTETLWNFGIGEGMLGFLEDARRRFLKPGARVVPERVELFMAPLQSDDFRTRLAEWPPDRHSLDFSAMRPYAMQQVQVPRLGPEGFLADPVELTRLDLRAPLGTEIGARAEFTIGREGTLHGFAGWFEAELGGGVRIGNAPPAEGSSWAHVFFPVEQPVPVAPGDPVSVRVDTVANGTTWRWVTEADGRRFDQTTLFGFPFDPGAHARRAPAAQPRRSRAGDALAHVLARLDGGHTVGDIAAEIERDYADVAGDHGVAIDFVRDVAERYGS